MHCLDEANDSILWPFSSSNPKPRNMRKHPNQQVPDGGACTLSIFQKSFPTTCRLSQLAWYCHFKNDDFKTTAAKDVSSTALNKEQTSPLNSKPHLRGRSWEEDFDKYSHIKKDDTTRQSTKPNKTYQHPHDNVMTSAPVSSPHEQHIQHRCTHHMRIYIAIKILSFHLKRIYHCQITHVSSILYPGKSNTPFSMLLWNIRPSLHWKNVRKANVGAMLKIFFIVLTWKFWLQNAHIVSPCIIH